MNTLAKLEAGRTVLVVDNGENRNLALGIRNLKGVTLLPTQRSQRVSSAGSQERTAQRSRCAEILGGARKMTIYDSHPAAAGHRKGRRQER